MNKLEILGLIELLFYRDSLDNKQCTEQPNYTASEKLTGCGKQEIEASKENWKSI